MLNGHGNELTTLLFFLFLIAKSDIHFDVYLHCRSKLQVASLKLTGNVIFHFGFLHILIWQKSLLNVLDIITLLTTLFHDVALFFGKICGVRRGKNSTLEKGKHVYTFQLDIYISMKYLIVFTLQRGLFIEFRHLSKSIYHGNTIEHFDCMKISLLD